MTELNAEQGVRKLIRLYEKSFVKDYIRTVCSHRLDKNILDLRDSVPNLDPTPPRFAQWSKSQQISTFRFSGSDVIRKPSLVCISHV